MLVKTPVNQILTRYALPVQHFLRTEIAELTPPSSTAADALSELEAFYGQMRYHLGWVDAHFSPLQASTGKLLRPALLLLAYEAAGACGDRGDGDMASVRDEARHLRRALPAAAAIELFHNFSLIHDDIEDGDLERRHRPTVWALWGVSAAINTGDGLNSLSRLTLFKLLETGVEAHLVAELGKCFDRACLLVTEGQHLDLSFEAQEEISVASYLEMIARKTAALMACATEIGARLGTRDAQVIAGLRQCGLQVGMAFQIRDDLLGIWATREETGKTPAGDLLRRKKTLPVLHAFEHASPPDQALLRAFYQLQDTPAQVQVQRVLEILDRTQSRTYCQFALRERCQQARAALAQIAGTHALEQRALADLAVLIDYIAEDLWPA